MEWFVLPKGVIKHTINYGFRNNPIDDPLCLIHIERSSIKHSTLINVEV